MKTLLNILFLVTFCSYAQNDTIPMATEVLKYYSDITDSTPDIVITKKGIAAAEQLYALKNDKTNISLVLGTMYYTYATEYTKKNTGTTGFKYKGYIEPEVQKEALIMAKKHYEYFIAHTKVKDDLYRSAQNGIMKIDKKLTQIN